MKSFAFNARNTTRAIPATPLTIMPSVLAEKSLPKKSSAGAGAAATCVLLTIPASVDAPPTSGVLAPKAGAAGRPRLTFWRLNRLKISDAISAFIVACLLVVTGDSCGVFFLFENENVWSEDFAEQDQSSNASFLSPP